MGAKRRKHEREGAAEAGDTELHRSITIGPRDRETHTMMKPDFATDDDFWLSLRHSVAGTYDIYVSNEEITSLTRARARSAAMLSGN